MKSSTTVFKIPKTKVFRGKRYDLTGMGQISRGRAVLDDWADFQRRVNHARVHVVKVRGGYVAYISYKKS